MNERWAIALLIGAVIGGLVGWRIGARSAAERAVHGGALASILHRVGAMVFACSLPCALATLISGGGFLRAVVVSLTCFSLCLLCLFLHALLEGPALKRLDAGKDEGWTAEKARASGL